MCYALGHELAASHVVQLRAALADDLMDHGNDIALDVRDLRYIDSSGMRFLRNFGENLAKQGRKLVFFGPPEDIGTQLNEGTGLEVYPTLTDFERGFHETDPGLLKALRGLASGKGMVKSLQLACPLCNNHEVTGYLFDTENQEMVWTENDILPVWIPKDPKRDFTDFGVYEVAVCSNCFFSSNRLDWFTVYFSEGEVASSLTPDQISNLGNAAAARRNLVGESEHVQDPNYFLMPRQTRAAYLSWKLNEFTQKHLAPERKNTDGFEIAVSNFMMCRYCGGDSALLNEHMHTALAWLNNILQYPFWYSTQRLVKAHTYTISVLLAMDKKREARVLCDKLFEEYRNFPEFSFWLTRAKELVRSG